MGNILSVKHIFNAVTVLFFAASFGLVVAEPVHAFDEKVKPVMLNRTAISLGDPSKAENIFYDKDTSNDNMVWQNITNGCYSDIARETTGGGGEGVGYVWILRSSTKIGDGSCSPEKTTTLATPTNYNERKDTVFYRDTIKDEIQSVKADLLLPFKNTGLSARGNVSSIYIQKDVDPYSCPSLIVDQKHPNGWAYVMMERSDTAEKASDEYSKLIRDLGATGFFGTTDVSDFNDVCKAAGDDDDEGNLEKIGLPESYFDAGSEKDNYEEVTFGYPGSSIGSVDIHQMFGLDAAGMALSGPLAGGFIASGELENGGEGSAGSDDPVCSAGALGWVLCPLSEALVGAIEGIAGLLKSLLIYQPLLNSKQGDAIKAIWQSLLVIANVGLAIAMLVIVFSQATSVGLSSYGIKKLLPRVIATAILMNLSFYLCAIAVDISNILGVSIKGIIDAGMERITDIAAIDPDLQRGADSADWIVTITGAVLVTGIAAATGAIFLLIPILAAGLMAMLTALLIVAARQVLITLLIIVAPIAFLAWILPNTEEWFTKWRKIFTVLLLMFPLIMIIFYGAILMSAVIMTAGTNTGNAVNNFTVTLLGFLVLIVPLFSLPFVMKSVGGVLERFGAITNNRGKGLVDRSRKFAHGAQKNSRFNNALQYRKENRDYARTVRRGNNTRFNRAMGTVGGSGYTAYAARKSSALQDKEYEQMVSDAATGQSNFSSDRRNAIANTGIDENGRRVTGQERVAAARWVMQNGNFAQRAKLYESMEVDTPGMSKEEKEHSERLRQSVNSGFYSRGDNAIFGAAFGGELLTGEGGSQEAIERAVASNIQAGKITAEAMVHDADATDLVLKVTRSGAVDAEAVDNVAKAAQEALSNEGTRRKAVAGNFNDKITALSQMGSQPSIAPGSGEIIIPRTSSSQSTPPSQTQQDRERGGNFNNGPGQTPPDNT